MTDEEFKQKLSEVAEWKLPKLVEITRGRGLSKNRYRGKPRDVDDLSDEEEQPFEPDPDLVKEGTNQTYPPVISKLKIQPVKCEDCGKFCEKGRRKEIQLYFKHRKTFSREKCMTCKKHKDPVTNEFILSPSKSSIVWFTFMKTAGTKKYNAKMLMDTREIVRDEQGRLVDEQESQSEIIRKYLD